MSHRRLLLPLLLLALAGFVAAQPTLSKDELPDSPQIIEREGKFHLQSRNQVEFEIVGVTAARDLLVATSAGPITIHRDVVTENGAIAIETLAALLHQAAAAGVDPTTLRLRDVALIGPHLSSKNVWVLPEGVVRRVEGTPPIPKVALTEAVASVTATLRDSTLSAFGKESIAHVLTQLQESSQKDDFLTPDFSRHLVRRGWLRPFLGATDPVLALETALTQAEAERTTTHYAGENLEVRQIEDTFGFGGWILKTPARSGYAVELQKPHYWPDSPTLALVVMTPPGSAPEKATHQALSYAVYSSAEPLATATAAGAFRADLETWRKHVKAEGPTVDTNLVSNYLPPHIPVYDMEGRIHALITAHGTIVPPADGGSLEVERFLEATAQALPDAAHLDLFGEYLFFYVLDSPDVRLPGLIGNKDLQGEIHQTLAQTLGTSSGGICRGDCDDLAEVYQAITRRQGKISHIMNVPAHNTCGFAEQEDGQWRVFVLQTGQPLEFRHEELPKALELAYESFGVLDAYDPDQTPIAVRFSGENTRSNWVLSWRIFKDAAYAEAMIDVQRDWHFHTYSSGIQKMKRMVEAGDKDPANFRELAGLAESTGQWAEAAMWTRKALESSQEKDPTLSLATRLISNLYESGDKEAARTVVEDVTLNKLGSAKAELGAAFTSVALGVAATVVGIGEDAVPAQRLFEKHVSLELQRQMGAVLQFLNGRRFDKELWDQSPEMIQLRGLFRSGFAVARSLADHAGPEALENDDQLRRVLELGEAWVRYLALHDVTEPSDLLSRYGDIGSWYSTLLGSETLLRLLDAVSFPRQKVEKPSARIEGVAQLRIDLPWIKTSLGFWTGELTDLFSRDKSTLDKSHVARIVASAEAALVKTKVLELSGVVFDYNIAACRLIGALVDENEAALLAHFRYVKEQNDKFHRDTTAEWIGNTARFLDAKWFARVLELWHQELGTKNLYFLVAWSAMQNKAPTHALNAATLATKAFPNDATFAEEFKLLSSLIR